VYLFTPKFKADPLLLGDSIADEEDKVVIEAEALWAPIDGILLSDRHFSCFFSFECGEDNMYHRSIFSERSASLSDMVT
jgi:hypothetical protein